MSCTIPAINHSAEPCSSRMEQIIFLQQTDWQHGRILSLSLLSPYWSDRDWVGFCYTALCMLTFTPWLRADSYAISKYIFISTMPLSHFECLNEPSQFARIIQSNGKTEYSHSVLNQMRKDELSFWVVPRRGGVCFQHFTGWIAVQGVGSFCSNTGRGALECCMQSPISDFLPHNAPSRFHTRARESLLYSEWQHNYPTGSNNGQSSFIHRSLWVVSLRKAPKQHCSRVVFQNAIMH